LVDVLSGGRIGLTTLSLAKNAVSRTGACILAKWLATNTALTVLDLSVNRIDDAGGKDLADRLRTNSTLTELYLDSNNLGERAAESFMMALMRPHVRPAVPSPSPPTPPNRRCLCCAVLWGGAVGALFIGR
jgi:Ran GTPase-activating protein (RanGAP) involved in mRNA processing and transport